MTKPKHPKPAYTPPSGERIRAWREDRGWSKAELRARLGLSQHPLDAYEAGERPMPKFVALAYAALAFGLPPLE